MQLDEGVVVQEALDEGMHVVGTSGRLR